MMLSGIRRIVGNATYSLTSDVVNRATTFVLYALVARYLSTYEFGQMSLALSLFYTFQVLTLAGLPTLITREVARDQALTARYLVNGTLIVAALSIVSVAGLLLLARVLNYSADTASVIVLLCFGLLPYSLAEICEAVFRGWERMRYIAYANVPVNIIKVGLAFLLVSQSPDLSQLIVLLLASLAAIACIEWMLILRYIVRPRVNDIDYRFALTMARSGSTFLGIDGIIAVKASFDVVILSKLASETEVGLLNAATQLLVPVLLIYQSIVVSVFPIMCRKFAPDLQNLKRITIYLLEVLLIIALPTTVGLFILADSALLLLYGDRAFLAAAPALRIVVWILIVRALTLVLGQSLMASQREKVTLRIVITNTLIGLALGLALISQFGLIGAALAGLLAAVINFFQHYVSVSKRFSGMPLASLIWKPALAGACVAIYLATMRTQWLVIDIGAASALYFGVLLALALWSSGGPRQLKAKYLYIGVAKE
jgi:O-antigen/teichoic acid export membrane protein